LTNSGQANREVGLLFAFPFPVALICHAQSRSICQNAAPVASNLPFNIDPQAYDAGFEAGKAGEFPDTCPYAPMTLESLSWHSGYIEGKAQRQQRPA